MDILVGPRITRRKFVKLAASAAAVLAGSLWTRSDAPNARADAPSIRGRVIDVLTGKPVIGARVQVVPRGPSTLTDSQGRYLLSVDAGLHDVRVTAPGYIAVTVVKRHLDPDEALTVGFEMVPADPTEEEERVIYDRVVKPSSWSENVASLGALALTTTASVPSSIRVLKLATNTVDVLDLEEYLKGVVPSEMPASWHPEALRAQAVAARCYAAQAVAWPRHGTTADVCDGPHCQVWRPYQYSTTNAAVADTRGVVATYGGAIIGAFFFSQCNGQTTRNSEEALASSDGWKSCSVQGWSYVPYCRARPCGGHGPYSSTCGYYGHGVGMCQWGAKAKADSGKGYMTIVHEYYTGVTMQGAPDPVSPGWIGLVQTNTLQQLQWTPAGDQHRVEIRRDTPDGQIYADSNWISATSWTTMFAEPGTYYWRVKARTGSAETVWSEARKLIAATTVYKDYLPLVSKNAS